MATSTVSKVSDNSTDANFIAWSKAISDAFIAFGWTRTADTGQINWGTVTRPVSGNVAQGYEVFAFNDTLQATAPYFLKIEYGSGGAVNNPGLWLTLGTGTNGAGSLSGTVTARLQVAAPSNVNATHVCKFAGDNSRFVCALWPEYNSASNHIAFGIERTHNADGDDTATAAVLFAATASIKNIMVCPNAGTGGAPTAETSFGTLTPISASSVRGTNFGLFYIYPFLGPALNPIRNAAVYFNAEITANMEISGSLYGEAHNLYTIGGSTGGYSRGSGTDNTNSRLAIRYD